MRSDSRENAAPDDSPTRGRAGRAATLFVAMLLAATVVSCGAGSDGSSPSSASQPSPAGTPGAALIDVPGVAVESTDAGGSTTDTPTAGNGPASTAALTSAVPTESEDVPSAGSPSVSGPLAASVAPSLSASSTQTSDDSSPESVRDDYMRAYEHKSFSNVLAEACTNYKEKYGTDTSALENQLSPYSIVSTASGDPTVTGDQAKARIDLELMSADGSRLAAKIQVKAVREGGRWLFCGEAPLT